MAEQNLTHWKKPLLTYRGAQAGEGVTITDYEKIVRSFVKFKGEPKGEPDDKSNIQYWIKNQMQLS